MAEQQCGSCGGEGGIAGPCPMCGALPGINVVASDVPPPPSEVRRVTVNERRRRTALAVVMALVGLIALSVAWDALSGSSETDDDAVAAPASSTTTSVVRGGGQIPPPTSSSIPGVTTPEGDVVVEPVPGFDGQWLLVHSGLNGEVFQVPLGGGVIERLATGRSDRGTMYMTQIHVVGDMLVGPDGTASLLDGSSSTFDSTEGWGMIAGRPTPWGTLVLQGHRITERTVDGTTLNAWDLAEVGGVDGFLAGVIDRYLIHGGPHGIYRFALDTGELTRIGNGAVIALGTNVVVARVCDARFECVVVALDVNDGTRRGAPLGMDPGLQAMYGPWSMATVSPDDTRLAITTGSGVELFDLETGRLLGLVDDDGVSSMGAGQPSVVWAADSSRALMVTSLWESPRGSQDAGTIVHFDRDLQTVERLWVVEEAVRSVAPRINLTYLLMDRRIELPSDK